MLLYTLLPLLQATVILAHSRVIVCVSVNRLGRLARLVQYVDTPSMFDHTVSVMVLRPSFDSVFTFLINRYVSLKKCACVEHGDCASVCLLLRACTSQIPARSSEVSDARAELREQICGL